MKAATADAKAKNTMNLISMFANGKMDPKLTAAYPPGSEKYDSIWQAMMKSAEKYNNPDTFTAIIGYEWTSLYKGASLHRNALLRDNGYKASQIVLYTMSPLLGSNDPMDLYK